MPAAGIWTRGDSFLALVFLLIVGQSTFVMVDGVDSCFAGPYAKLCKSNQKAYCFYADCSNGINFVTGCAPSGATNREAGCEKAKEVCSRAGFGSGPLERCLVCNSKDACNYPGNPLDDMPNPPKTDPPNSVIPNNDDKPKTPMKEEENGGVGKNGMSAIMVSSVILIALMMKQLLGY